MSQMTRKTLRVSVIIPTYNRASLVKAAIMSVLSQNEFLPLEIIVLDDASSDETTCVIEELKKESAISIVYYKSPNNVGPSKLRNIGIQKAQGEFIAFLDSDDLWTSNKLLSFNSDLSKNSSIAIWTHLQDSESDIETLSTNLAIVPYWKQLLKNHASCSCTIIRKNANQKFREEMKHNEDHEFFTRICYSSPLYLNHSVLTIRNRKLNAAGGLSGNIWKMRLGEMKTYIKATSYNRKLIPLLPFLLLFSLLKHARLIVRSA